MVFPPINHISIIINHNIPPKKRSQQKSQAKEGVQTPSATPHLSTSPPRLRFHSLPCGARLRRADRGRLVHVGAVAPVVLSSRKDGLTRRSGGFLFVGLKKEKNLGKQWKSRKNIGKTSLFQILTKRIRGFAGFWGFGGSCLFL